MVVVVLGFAKHVFITGFQFSTLSVSLFRVALASVLQDHHKRSLSTEGVKIQLHIFLQNIHWTFSTTRLKVAYGDRLALWALVSPMVWSRFWNFSILKISDFPIFFDCFRFSIFRFPIFRFLIIAIGFYRPLADVHKISCKSVEGGRSYEGGTDNRQTHRKTFILIG